MKLCPFCKTPNAESDEEEVRRTEKLMEKGNAEAFNQLARYYDDGTMGLPQDQAKANELYLKAGELGHAEAYYNLGCSYRTGDGVEIDTKKAKHYDELAAMNGSVQALKWIYSHQKSMLGMTNHYLLFLKVGGTFGPFRIGQSIIQKTSILISIIRLFSDPVIMLIVLNWGRSIEQSSVFRLMLSVILISQWTKNQQRY